VTHDPIDILLPGGVALLTLEFVQPSTGWEFWGVQVELRLRLRRPWDEDPPTTPDADLTLFVQRRSVLIHGHQSIF
jgi:hypothetical protein